MSPPPPPPPEESGTSTAERSAEQPEGKSCRARPTDVSPEEGRGLEGGSAEGGGGSAGRGGGDRCQPEPACGGRRRCRRPRTEAAATDPGSHSGHRADVDTAPIPDGDIRRNSKHEEKSAVYGM